VCADILYLDNYRPFDPYDDPCSKCPIKEGCCTTCEKAERFWNKLADLIGYNEEEPHL